jgi:hypothetical protein
MNNCNLQVERSSMINPMFIVARDLFESVQQSTVLTSKPKVNSVQDGKFLGTKGIYPWMLYSADVPLICQYRVFTQVKLSLLACHGIPF